MKRKRSRGAAGMDSGMKVENRSLRIRVPAELDHHSAAQICAQADELVRTQDIREIVFGFFPDSFLRQLRCRYADGQVQDDAGPGRNGEGSAGAGQGGENSDAVRRDEGDSGREGTGRK